MVFVGVANGDFALDYEDNALGFWVGFGGLAAAVCADFHDVLREGFGETCHWAGNDPSAGVLPVWKLAGDDVLHDAARDDGVGVGEDRAVRHDLALRREAP